MRLTLDIWRQADTADRGRLERYVVDDATPEMSLLELLDRLNDRLIAEGGEPIAFDSDCREGICGSCGLTVDDRPHGPVANTPSCRQHLRSFADGAHTRIEPLRSAAYPVVRDLVVDRSALDRILQAGGHIAVDAGTAADADAEPLPHERAEYALDFAACIGCGACVAACPNGAAHLFAGSKLLHLATVVRGAQERGSRAKAMVAQMEEEFGP
jgi:succinate dehydrogenase / fumarate reductase iron-sulfur subunit